MPKHRILSLLVAFVLCFIFSGISSAQETVANLRLGVNTEATYRVAEVFQKRGRLTLPSLSYVDFGRVADYREWVAGVGYDLVHKKNLVITEGLYFVQSGGESSHNTRYVQPWTEVQYQSESEERGFEAEAAVFPYIAINSSSHMQLVVERAKVEYRLSPVLKFGVGYGADKFKGEQFEHKPFLTTTLTPFSPESGSFEFWLQRLPEDKMQMQFRYKILRKGGHEH